MKKNGDKDAKKSVKNPIFTNKFKIGDKVTVLYSCDGSADPIVGEVVRIENNLYIVLINNYGYEYEYEEIDLVDELDGKFIAMENTEEQEEHQDSINEKIQNVVKELEKARAIAAGIGAKNLRQFDCKLLYDELDKCGWRTSTMRC